MMVRKVLGDTSLWRAAQCGVTRLAIVEEVEALQTVVTKVDQLSLS